jgi:hypothetical protein
VRKRLRPYASFTWRDESGDSVTGRLSFAEVAAAVALDAAGNVAALAEGCSGCVIDAISLTYPKDDPDPRPALAGARQENGAVFIFETSDDLQLFVIDMPGVAAGIFDTTQDPPDFYVNRSNTAVAAFVNVMTSGIWCNPWGHTITSLIAAYKIVQ